MAENDKYPREPRGNFHLIGTGILIAIVVVIVTALWKNPPGEGTVAVPTQTGTERN
jgi:hypothetical protein